MRYALIEDNQVKDIFIEPEGFSIEDCFTPEIAFLYILCPDNISEGDFYDPDTQEFTENPDKKFPNYTDWFNSLRNKETEILNYAVNLNPTINGLPMNIGSMNKYVTQLNLATNGITPDVEIDNQSFSVDDFKLMLISLNQFEKDKDSARNLHSSNISSLNDATDIDAYDFSTGWPETIISIV
jgi:hypothetical protein